MECDMDWAPCGYTRFVIAYVPSDAIPYRLSIPMIDLK